MANIEALTKNIDQCFFDYINNGISDKEFCSRLGMQAMLVSTATGIKKEFEITLIDGGREFYAMCCYPNLDQISNILEDMNDGNKFKKRWVYDINSYTIEIDKNLFDKTIISFTPKELTAMLLHEIAHTAYNDKLPEKMYISYKHNMSILKMQDRSAIRAVQKVFYTIPAIVMCGFHHWNIGRNGMSEEYICDQVFGIKTYKEHLLSAIDKIIHAYGTTLFKSDAQEADLLNERFKWCNLNIVDLGKRREAIRRDLMYTSKNTKSKALKRAYLDLLMKFGIGMKDKYTGALIAAESVIFDDSIPWSGLYEKYELTTVPQYNGAIEKAIENAVANSHKEFKAAMESAKRGKAPKLPTQYDIDVIRIDLDKITNHYDRINVLDEVHSRIEQIEEFKEFHEYIGDYKQHSDKVEAMLKELEIIRQDVLKRAPVNNKRYGVFVKYPEGYEG